MMGESSTRKMRLAGAGWKELLPLPAVLMAFSAVLMGAL
jgi:hypothetical protein